MIKHGRCIVVTMLWCLLAVATSGAAECAWVLWSEDTVIPDVDPPEMRVLWTFVQAETTKQACEEARGLRLAAAKKRGAKVDGQGFVFPEVNKMVRYFCSPDTVDPRRPKRK